METKIALAGNPNCGKTTLFNQLTGSNQYVGNWPGVTVEKKEGRLKGHKDVVIQDLPGIYSLSPYTLEEVVSRNYLVREKPDAILNIVDGTNIERNLYLTTQLIELGLPVVVAVNMIDLVRRNGDQIDLARLGQALGCQVVEMSALKGEGGMAAAEKAVEAAAAGRKGELPHVFTGSVEHALAHIEESIAGLVDEAYLRWYAIKIFERDEKVLEELKLTDELAAHLEAHIADCETELDDDAESIITNQRYAYISGVVGKAVRKKAAAHSLSVSDKIDRVVTNRLLALPIFAGVMFLIYAIAMGSFAIETDRFTIPISIGTAATDFTNDVIFGEWVPGLFHSLLTGLGVAEGTWMYGLIQDGIVAGVGAVLGFVPQMLVLFLLLAVLEDVGYMARVAFIMDRIFRRFGLSGKSFIPMLVATGCGVPLRRQDAHHRPVCRCPVRLFRLGGRLRLLHRCGSGHRLRYHAQEVQGFCRGACALRHGAARLSCSRRQQCAAGHLGAWLVFHQAGGHGDPAFLHRAVVPPGLWLCGWRVPGSGGQQRLLAGCYRQRHRVDLLSSGLDRPVGLEGRRGYVHRPHRQGRGGQHLRRFVPLCR